MCVAVSNPYLGCQGDTIHGCVYGGYYSASQGRGVSPAVRLRRLVCGFSTYVFCRGGRVLKWLYFTGAYLSYAHSYLIEVSYVASTTRGCHVSYLRTGTGYVYYRVQSKFMSSSSGTGQCTFLSSAGSIQSYLRTGCFSS